MRNYFTLGGEDSRNFGVYISGTGVFNSPSRAMTFYDVPGRNGALIGMETRLQNGDLTYPAFIVSDFDSNLSAFKAMLLKTTAYRRLIDSYHPNEYRNAVFTGPLNVQPHTRLKAGKFDLKFTVMPQRFLLSGDTVTTLTASGTITNPTQFNAQPLIRVYGNGVLGVGSTNITIINADVYTDIDCAMGYAYKGANNKNLNVTLSSRDFPTLAPGDNGITLGSGITRVEITPRWWTV